MSTSPVPAKPPQSPALLWFEAHVPELRSRARRYSRRFPRSERDDAVAEILGLALQYCVSAARRGKLACLTPFTLISFFARSYAQGRRVCGTRSRDVFSPVGQRRRGTRIISLSERRWVRTPTGLQRLRLCDVLADRRASSPLENCRRNLDYPSILRRGVSRKARRVFAWLAATQGSSRQVELARQLGVSPPRIKQLKRELASHLARAGYGLTRLRLGR